MSLLNFTMYISFQVVNPQQPYNTEVIIRRTIEVYLVYNNPSRKQQKWRFS